MVRHALLAATLAACGKSGAPPAPGSGNATATAPHGTTPALRGPKASAIGMSFRTAIALLDDGTLRAWGNGQFGLLGTGAGGDSATPIVVPGVTGADALEVSNEVPLACAHLNAGGWSCWGDGRALPGEKADVRTPAAVPALARMRALSLAAAFGCGIRDDGQLECWGKVPPLPYDAHPRPLAAVAGIHDAVAVATRADGACVVEQDGSVWCWGKDDYAQTSATTDQPDEKRVVPSPRRVPDIDDAIDVQLALENTCVRRRSGTLACWGHTFGLRGVVTVPSEASAHLLDAKRLDLCEANAAGQVRCLAARGKQSCAGVRTPDDLNRCLSTEQTYTGGDAWFVLPIEPARELATDLDSSCALSLAGDVSCWGKNDLGQLGDGMLVTRELAKPVVSLVDVLPTTAPPTPPPPPAARPTAWQGRPSDCAYDTTLDLAHVRVHGPLEVRAAFAKVGGLVEVALHDHDVDPATTGHPPELVAHQRSLRFVLSNQDARGQFIAVTAGTFTIAPAIRGRSAEIIVQDPHTYADTLDPAVAMIGTVTITHLGGGWVCGRVDAAGKGGHAHGRFAAEVVPASD